jgi:NOL1/NOP2/sun family putative RNA methylase
MRERQNEPQHDTYIEEDAPQHKETGEFFLERYRRIDGVVRVVAPSAIKQALRVNVLRTTAQELQSRLAVRGATLVDIPFLRHGFYVEAPFSLGATEEYLLGHYYLQAPLSQLACEVLRPTLGSAVLDMAAAPGGKATYLATMVAEKGMVVALDNDASRLAAVRNNAERLGVTNILCIKKDARFAHDLKVAFPFVLLDAPCSGNFCSEEEWFGMRTLADIKENTRVQKELLKSAHACLAPCGRLLYSTCSLEPEEDELMIDWFLNKYPGMKVIPLNLPVGDPGATHWEGQKLNSAISGTRRFWPHKTGMEGFYMALLEKSSSSS